MLIDDRCPLYRSAVAGRREAMMMNMSDHELNMATPGGRQAGAPERLRDRSGCCWC